MLKDVANIYCNVLRTQGLETHSFFCFINRSLLLGRCYCSQAKTRSNATRGVAKRGTMRAPAPEEPAALDELWVEDLEAVAIAIVLPVRLPVVANIVPFPVGPRAAVLMTVPVGDPEAVVRAVAVTLVALAALVAGVAEPEKMTGDWKVTTKADDELPMTEVFVVDPACCEP